ncbi:ATP-binding protein [Aeromicrobium fastidiosum]|uniref:ATP-binding protein n=1 Tax=Aeromicrobium fastidiosum TaxID=52699 RepID=A0A641AV80_9ACTN|nr:ATP-binding protein [Aeromicrobium fastidiosum]
MVDARLQRLLSAFPAVALLGPRAVGKTTTARSLAGSVVRLDRAAEAAAFEADPDAALIGLAEPVLLDEWQEVPGVLGAVKRAVDDSGRPGRFILSGSVRAELDTQTWPGTGRVIQLAMRGLTVAELEGASASSPFLQRVTANDPAALGPGSEDDLRSYVQRALRSGFPYPALRLSDDERRTWLAGYVDQVVSRDAPHVGGARSTVRLRRYLEALALVAGGVVTETTILQASGLNRATAQSYEQLFVDLHILDLVPSWHSNRISRLVKMPKRYLSDAALIAGVGGLTAEDVMRDGDILGRVLDNFVYQQIRAECGVMDVPPRLYHLRNQDARREVDMLVELGGGRIVGIEVKATASPSRHDARHLEWLRDELGEAFVAGVVLHTGPRAFSLGDRVTAAPISTLWCQVEQAVVRGR